MAKRAFQAIVLFFAVCGFLFVPLGKRTAIEHLQAILGTPAAQQAGTELKNGVVRLFDRLRSRSGRSADGVNDELDGELDSVHDDVPVSPRKPRSLKPPREVLRDGDVDRDSEPKREGKLKHPAGDLEREKRRKDRYLAPPETAARAPLSVRPAERRDSSETQH